MLNPTCSVLHSRLVPLVDLTDIKQVTDDKCNERRLEYWQAAHTADKPNIITDTRITQSVLTRTLVMRNPILQMSQTNQYMLSIPNDAVLLI